jgi:hypothetical protein
MQLTIQKRLSPLMIAVISCISIVSVCAVVITGLHFKRAHDATQESTVPISATYTYLIQEKAGVLQVYVAQDNALKPVADYEIAIDSLPQKTQSDLAQGIALKNAAELQEALEDYLS